MSEKLKEYIWIWTPVATGWIFLVLSVTMLLSGCNTLPHLQTPSDTYVYKYNPLEAKYELAHPQSRLRYNVFEREWVFAR